MTFDPKSKNIPYTLGNDNAYVNAGSLYYAKFWINKSLTYWVLNGFKSKMTP
jgi:hypothetical protein